ncbi:MAG: hypothetical protein FD146_540 [Anaerolineaceae bacterium]|nr:MAG: hypothetical protein FD146_540 [Anaerolineaceae bacterium]
MKKTLLLALAVLLLGACTPKCDVDAYKASVAPILTEWSDAFALATQTPRISLAPQVEALQDIKREAETLDIPQCAVESHSHLIASMDHSINAMMAFLANKPDAEVNASLQRAQRELNLYADAVEALYPDE